MDAFGEEPPRPVEAVLPDERVRFHATARLAAAGTVQVGVAGVATNEFLQPVARTVRVVHTLSLMSGAAITFVTYGLILGAASLLVRALASGSPPAGAAPWRPDWRVVAAALLLAVLAPSLLLTYVPAGRAPSPATVWAAYAAVGLFAAGWVLAGAGLRPRGSAWRGAAAAALLYVMTGLLLYTGFGAATGTPPLPLLRALLTPNGAGFALLWPLLVAQQLGVFDLRMA